MDTCTIETGLLRRKPCGHAATTRCLNCDQPLCTEHAIAQLAESGARTGKFMCKECAVAEKQHAKAVAAAARNQELRKHNELARATRDQIAHPPAVKKPAAAPEAQAPEAAPKAASAPEALEFTPSKKPGEG